MTLLVVTAPTYAAALADVRRLKPTCPWCWIATPAAARNWLERAERMGIAISATIWVAGEKT